MNSKIPLVARILFIQASKHYIGPYLTSCSGCKGARFWYLLILYFYPVCANVRKALKIPEPIYDSGKDYFH